METIKKHIISIVSGAVVLLALVAAWFISFESATKNLEDSANAYNKIKNLNTASFSLPLLDPRKLPPRVPSLFPSDEALNLALKIVKDYQKSATDFVKDAEKLNGKNRKLLVPNVLPDGRGATLMSFKSAYAQAFAELARELNAAPPPGEAEIAAAQAARKDTPDLATDPALREQADAELMRQLNAAWASKYTMYISPQDTTAPNMRGAAGAGNTGSFDIYDAIPKPTDGEPPELSAVWSATLSYWIQEDIVQAIRKTNGLTKLEKAEKNATTRPFVPITQAIVKRLVCIDIPKEYITRRGPLPIADAAERAGIRNQMPAAWAGAAGTGTAELPISAPPGFKDYTVSPTGRVCTTLYDVMHFTLVVDVDANKYAALLAHLEDDHFITILGVDMRAIDKQAWQNQGYYYGPDPVVQLVIDGEAIFFRDWTLDFMPAGVKSLLGIKATTILKK